MAFSEIYRRYWDKLFYWASKKLGDIGEAENLVQDIFVDLWQRKQQLVVTGSLQTYLAVALKYRILNVQARAWRADRFRQFAASHSPQNDRSTEAWLQFEELKDQLAALVTKLPDQCRIAYTLREDGLSQKEIARVMHISEHTVERHVGRALQFLRKGLSQLFNYLLML